MKRRGFTLLEVLIAVVLITILSTLLIVGVDKLRTNAKRQQTRQTLETAKALFAEYNSIVRPRFSSSVMPCPANVTPDGTDRYSAPVWVARDLIYDFRAMPVNASAIGKMSPGSLMTFPPGATFPYTDTQYVAASHVIPFTSGDFGRVYVTDASNNKMYFDCIGDNTITNGGVTSYVGPPDTAFWVPAYPLIPGNGNQPDNSVPVLLDAWGNPILFVPSILGNPSGSSAGMLTAGGTVGFQVKSPDGRPFFASAGPDGDFSKGDDNLYSFEK